MKIRLSRDAGRGNVLGGKMHRKQGDIVHIEYAQWPGKSLETGTIGDILREQEGRPRVHDDWSFWSSHDIDGAFIWTPDVVEALIVTSAERIEIGEETIGAAPFAVEDDAEELAAAKGFSRHQSPGPSIVYDDSRTGR